MNLFIATIQQNEAVLNPEESLHCARVLRKRPGDVIQVIDGLGGFYEGKLEVVSDKRCTVRINTVGWKQSPRRYQLHIAVAPTKQIDRLEWFLEKAVELGIDEISLIRCRNSERVQVNEERLRKIIESAVKQSLQAFIPKLNGLLDFRQFIGTVGVTDRYLAHCGEGKKRDIRDLEFRDRNTLVLIGPEGDFSPEEVREAETKDFCAISLSENRLRTETAALAVVSAAFVKGI